MTFILLPLLISLITLGHFFREGVPFPFMDDYQVQVWNFFISHQAHDFWFLLKENLIIWCLLYIPSQLFLYSELTRDFVKDYKFNPKYPNKILMLKEMIRSIRGVYICSVYESIVYRLPLSSSEVFSFLQPIEGTPLSLSVVVLGGIVLYLWGDAHFYFAHRWLHSKWLYKNVHKYHHESYNPTPFSGLSMHWFESMVYFSAAPMLAMTGVPLWLFRLMTKGLLVFPLEGHDGYGTWSVETSFNHYIHHAKFDYNYGSSPLWDHLLGTDYKLKAAPGSRTGGKGSQQQQQEVAGRGTAEEQKRQQNAREQARLVGCDWD